MSVLKEKVKGDCHVISKLLRFSALVWYAIHLNFSFAFFWMTTRADLEETNSHRKVKRGILHHVHYSKLQMYTRLWLQVTVTPRQQTPFTSCFLSSHGTVKVVELASWLISLHLILVFLVFNFPDLFPMPTHYIITRFGFHARWIDGVRCGLF